MAKRSHVPVLITWDVDPDRWTTIERRRLALRMAMDLCQEFDVRSTFFVTARYAPEYPDEFQRMQALDQEIGCHGLTHDDDEEYDRMPEATQRVYIEDATGELEAVIGGPVRAFRSPRVKISSTTLQLLAERGYLADSSICSGRLDVLSSNLINTGWLVAPRRPYYPHHAHPFKRGDLSVLEVPVSALAVPFISKALNALGLPAMKALFRLLYAESRHTGKPIVYMSHPTEFILAKGAGERHALRRLLSPSFFSLRRIRTHGFLIRNALLRMCGETLFHNSRQLFAYMASFPDVSFMTMSEYAGHNLADAT